MKPLYLFDVDGTLTPSRCKINEEFELFMIDFCGNHDCVIVTGSDQQKTIEQIGERLYDKFKVRFQCSGNQVFVGKGELLYESHWKLPDVCKHFLERCESESQFDIRTGNHIEYRPGMVNFSIVGRNAGMVNRAKYTAYDQKTKEREKIARAFNTMFPDLKATIGGLTGLDIAPIGKDKGQVTEWFTEREFIFFGDDCQEGGNDYALASKIVEKNLGIFYNVKDCTETQQLLKENY